MQTASLVPATMRSRSLSSISAAVGRTIELAVHAAEPDRAIGLEERDVRDVQGRTRADHGEHVRIVLPVGGEDRGVDLHFVEVIGREERASGAVDHARGERFLGARAASRA